MPWIGVNEIKRFIESPFRSRKLRYSGVDIGQDCRFYGKPIIQKHRGSKIALGDNVSLRSSPRSNPLSPNHPVVLSTRAKDAEIRIGDECGFTGTTIVSEDAVTLGKNVTTGSNSVIVDTDFHPTDPETRMDHFTNCDTEPVKIGQNVFIGMNSIILKGVSIGDGGVVGAGSVVSQDVPERTLVAGNPATEIRKL